MDDPHIPNTSPPKMFSAVAAGEQASSHRVMKSTSPRTGATPKRINALELPRLESGRPLMTTNCSLCCAGPTPGHC
ncbi:hypothetical protein Sp245p_15980 (plasmid) [Azospirillum baldaniorum]|uniref:Uncharacterized protein n=1 Tax=Azospirillum baldaniorum TaxID=1064539 RepID=A0A9P1NN98_9PROT|nr:hypothetical protein Sp245p_15980 [Azospirillum baldaniorum]CCC99608.1 protein of unknown function [Azospirillum baldaniorum]